MNCGGRPLYMRHEVFWWIKTGLPKKDNFTFSQIIVHCSSAITPIVYPYLIIVTDATDAVSVNFSGRCKFLLI